MNTNNKSTNTENVTERNENQETNDEDITKIKNTNNAESEIKNRKKPYCRFKEFDFSNSTEDKFDCDKYFETIKYYLDSYTVSYGTELGILKYLESIRDEDHFYHLIRYRSPIKFAGSNLSNLEKKMNGGLHPGHLHIVAGLPGSGKTTLLNNIADNLCLNKQNVLFLSLHEGREGLRIKTGHRFDYSQIDEIRPLKAVIEYPVSFGELNRMVDLCKNSYGGQYPVIIIDSYNQLITANDASNQHFYINSFLNQLCEIASKRLVPILMSCQIDLEYYRSDRYVTLACLKDGASIAYESSWICILGAFDIDENGYRFSSNCELKMSQGNVDLLSLKAARGTGPDDAIGILPLRIDAEITC
jgi:archaellum biogenesis ATPase FlaH